jgi:hypothetical protein
MAAKTTAIIADATANPRDASDVPLGLALEDPAAADPDGELDPEGFEEPKVK